MLCSNESFSLSKQMEGVTKGLSKVMQSMDLEKVSGLTHSSTLSSLQTSVGSN